MATKSTKAKNDNGAVTKTSVEGIDLSMMLKRLEKLAGTGGYISITVSPTKTKTCLSATNNGVTVETVLPEPTANLEAAWNFPYATLSSLVSGRKGVSLSMNDSTLVINSKNKGFSVKLIGSEATSVPKAAEPTTSDCEFQINGDTRVVMTDALNAVFLQKTLSALPDVTVHIEFKKKTVNVTAYDKSQMATYSAANTTGQEFSITLPLPRAMAVFKGTIGDAVVKAAEGILYAKSGTFKMSVSLPPADEASGVPVQRVIERTAQLRKMTLPKEVTFKKEDIVRFLENAQALTKTSAMLKMEVNANGRSKFTISAEGNSVEALIESRSKSTFESYVDVNYVQAVVSKTKDDSVSLAMDDSIFIFRNESLVYSAVLSSPPQDAPKKKKAKKTEGEEEES